MKLTDEWLTKTIKGNQVFLQGINSLYHNNFNFTVIVRPEKPWTPESIWWQLNVSENDGKTYLMKYESERMYHTGAPDWNDRVEVEIDELKFWKASKVFKKLVNDIINKLEKDLPNVSYSLKQDHRDFDETREIADKVISNIIALKP